ncbi:MAG: hypothetical protein R2754_13815 [Microthrixaceae bacterium]
MTTAGGPVGAAVQDVDLICTGTQGDSAGLFPDSGGGVSGGFDSRFLVSFLIGQIGQPEPTPDEPQIYEPRLSFAATARLDHDLPDVMLSTDAPADVTVSGEIQLTAGFLASLRRLGVTDPFGVEATTTARVGGPGVTGDSGSVAAVPVTQDPSAAPLSIPVDLLVTATPTAGGGAMRLDYSVDVAMVLDQQSSYPSPLDLGTLSMSCETSSEPQTAEYLGDTFGDLDLRFAVPEPLADGYVANPQGVVARTDRHFTSAASMSVNVLANDDALGAGRSIDPDSLEVTSVDGLIDVALADNRLHFTSSTIPFSESPFNSFDGPAALDTDRFPTIAGFGYQLLTRARVDYRVCDDGDPASCADGLAEVIMPVEVGDPCEDPNIDIDCTPYEPPVDTTCVDDMSVCEVPGCTWSETDDRYVCVYPGRHNADPDDPTDPPSGDDPPPSSGDDPPDGNGPGNEPRPPEGTPLTPAFTD